MKLQKPPRVHSLWGQRAPVTAPGPSQHPRPRPAPRRTPHLPHLVLAAAGFPEVGHGRQLGVDGLPVEPAVVQVDHGLLCVLLAAELKRGDRALATRSARSRGRSAGLERRRGAATGQETLSTPRLLNSRCPRPASRPARAEEPPRRRARAAGLSLESRRRELNLHSSQARQPRGRWTRTTGRMTADPGRPPPPRAAAPHPDRKAVRGGPAHLHVDVPDEVVPEVVADVHLLHLAVLLLHLREHLLQEHDTSGGSHSPDSPSGTLPNR